MSRRIALAVLVLVIPSCAHPCPPPDAGVDYDGGYEDTGRAPRTWGPNQTCVLVPERVADCGFDCPFLVGTTCDPERTLFCLWLLETQGGDCLSVASIVRSPDCANVCWTP